MFIQLLDWLKTNCFNKSFLLGSCFAIGVFSHYIFGANNLAEEVVEKLLHQTINIDIDFTPHAPEDPIAPANEVLDYVINLDNLAE